MGQYTFQTGEKPRTKREARMRLFKIARNLFSFTLGPMITVDVVHRFLKRNITTVELNARNPSHYRTGMRRIRDGFANRFAKPSQTVAKRSHGIAKSLHASRTRRELFAKVLNM